MLEANDLKAIASLMDEKFVKYHDEMDKKFVKYHDEMDKKFVKYHDEMDKKFEDFAKVVDERFVRTENLLLGEMEHDRKYLERQIAIVKGNLERLEQYSKITKLESDNTGLLLRMIEDLRKEMEELKRKIA